MEFMIQLVPFTQQDFEAYLERAITDYADEGVQAGNWSEAEAYERARSEFDGLLPSGPFTPLNHLFSVTDVAGDIQVGMIWFKEMRDTSPPYAFVFDLLIYEAFQGRGYGKQAMLAIEPLVRNLCLDSIRLHVFGHNRTARLLYEKLGYEITNINMRKMLS